MLRRWRAWTTYRKLMRQPAQVAYSYLRNLETIGGAPAEKYLRRALEHREFRALSPLRPHSR